MGKKSRVKTQKSGTGATTAVSPKEILNLISELLQSKYIILNFLTGKGNKNIYVKKKKCSECKHGSSACLEYFC